MSISDELRVVVTEPRWIGTVEPTWIVPLQNCLATAAIFEGGFIHLARFPADSKGETDSISSLAAATTAKGSPLKIHVIRANNFPAGQLAGFIARNGWPTFDHTYETSGYLTEFHCRTVGNNIRMALGACTSSPNTDPLPQERLLDVVSTRGANPGLPINEQQPAPSELRTQLSMMLLDKLFIGLLFVALGYFVNERIESYKSAESWRIEVAKRGLEPLEQVWTAFEKVNSTLQALIDGMAASQSSESQVNAARNAREDFKKTLATNALWLPPEGVARVRQQLDKLALLTSAGDLTSKEDEIQRTLRSIKTELLEPQNSK